MIKTRNDDIIDSDKKGSRCTPFLFDVLSSERSVNKKTLRVFLFATKQQSDAGAMCMRRVTAEPNGDSVELSDLQRQFHFFLRQRQFLQPST